MADQIMTVVDAVKSGILDVANNANAKAGNAAGAGYFYFPNDGRTVLVVVSGTGDTFTFTPVTDKYGRTETLAPVVAGSKTAIIGPFLPELWNDANGRVKFKPTVGQATDKLLAVRIPS